MFHVLVCVFQCVFVSPEGVLQISPVERGVVTLLGVRSRFFVAMNRRGKLYGSVSVPTFIDVFALSLNIYWNLHIKY